MCRLNSETSSPLCQLSFLKACGQVSFSYSDSRSWDPSLGNQSVTATQMLRNKLPQASVACNSECVDLSWIQLGWLRWESCAPCAPPPPPTSKLPGHLLVLPMAEVQKGKHKWAKPFKAKAKLACHHSTSFYWPKQVT